jgi:hypothetical protein
VSGRLAIVSVQIVAVDMSHDPIHACALIAC